MLDLIIRNGRIVTASEVLPLGLEIGVRQGKIAMIGHGLEAGSETEIVDAEGAYITPGGVDSHTHIEQENSPTGDNWETGSRSALAGGNTTILAFASQNRSEESIWPALEAYHRKATGNSYCDYGFHMIQPLKLDDGSLFNLLMVARELGITTMIHAENNDIIEQITALAEVTDAPILIVHMSAPTALKHVRDAQSRLLPIHAETCPHYLYLTSDKLVSEPHPPHDFDGARHICAPPLRHCAADVEQLWAELANGTYTVVSSDHAPSLFDHPDGKKRGFTVDAATGTTHVDFRTVPNGLPGIETRLPLLFHRTFDPAAGPPPGEAVHISLPRFVALTSTNPAQLYGLADRKGSLQPGLDADIVIWYPESVPGAAKPVSTPSSFVITNDKLHHCIDYTPFEGMTVRNWPRYVFLRGRRVWDRDHGGLLGAKGDGEFLKRNRSRILTGQMGRTATGMTASERTSWM